MSSPAATPATLASVRSAKDTENVNMAILMALTRKHDPERLSFISTDQVILKTEEGTDVWENRYEHVVHRGVNCGHARSPLSERNG